MDQPQNPQGELLLGAIGINAALRRGALKVTAKHREDALALPMRIRREVRRFLAATDWDDEKKPLPDFDYKTALEHLSEPMDEVRVEENLSGFEDTDEKLAFAAAYGKAIEYLQTVLPKRSRNTALGPKPYQPSDMELSRFRRALCVIEDPMLVLDDLTEGTLARDEITALAAVYPFLYDTVKGAVQEALVDLRAKRGDKFELPDDRDKMLQVLLQTRTFSPELAAEMQRAYEATRDEAKTGGGPLQSAAAEPTNVQRIADR